MTVTATGYAGQAAVPVVAVVVISAVPVVDAVPDVVMMEHHALRCHVADVAVVNLAKIAVVVVAVQGFVVMVSAVGQVNIVVVVYIAVLIPVQVMHNAEGW